MGAGFGFQERMAGTYTGRAPGFPGGAFHFDLEVRSKDFLRNLLDVPCRARGWLTMEGVCTDAPAEGSLEISPLWRRVIRYVLDFQTPEGRRLHFDGQKSIRWLSPVKTWTTLPGKVTDAATGEDVADVVARFHLRDLGALARSYRFLRAARPQEATA